MELPRITGQYSFEPRVTATKGDTTRGPCPCRSRLRVMKIHRVEAIRCWAAQPRDRQVVIVYADHRPQQEGARNGAGVGHWGHEDDLVLLSLTCARGGTERGTVPAGHLDRSKGNPKGPPKVGSPGEAKQPSQGEKRRIANKSDDQLAKGPKHI
jgi:hypothetical protein